jgi:antitoxin component YwqK of YwqJK toxin-antitoxin module
MEVIKIKYKSNMTFRKYLLISQVMLVAVHVFLTSCSGIKKEKAEELNSSAFITDDSVQIPLDTVLANAPTMKLDNGIYYYNNLVFSGYLKALYQDSSVQFIWGYFNGMQHGTSISYYPSGKLRDIRMYRRNKSYGKHIGYWENGNQKFEFYYLNDKREGPNKQWYISGQPYAFLTFKDDKEEGIQQAWRENGKPYINYHAKDGFRYGLQKSGLCYTLKDEKFNTK